MALGFQFENRYENADQSTSHFSLTLAYQIDQQTATYLFQIYFLQGRWLYNDAFWHLRLDLI